MRRRPSRSSSRRRWSSVSDMIPGGDGRLIAVRDAGRSWVPWSGSSWPERSSGTISRRPCLNGKTDLHTIVGNVFARTGSPEATLLAGVRPAVFPFAFWDLLSFVAIAAAFIAFADSERCPGRRPDCFGPWTSVAGQRSSAR